MINQKVPLFIFFCGQFSTAKMSETGASTSRSRTGLRFRERFSKLVKRPSSASGKSHLNVPELSTGESSSVLSIRSSRSDGGNATIDDSLFDVSTGDVSSATTSMNSHVTQMWQRALEAVMRDEEVKDAVILFESLLRDYMKQEKAVSTESKSSSEHEPKDVENALRLVDRTLQEGTKAQQALDTTLGVFAVVKGLSSFVGSMLSECPPAALAWAGVCACIPIITAPIEQHQSMIKGLRHIYARATIYFDLTGNLLQDGTHSSDLGSSIRTNIQPLYEGILKYIMLSICSVHRGKFSRFWEAISGQAQWETLLNNIEKAEESSLRNIQTIQNSKLLAVTAHFSERYTRAADREEDRRRNEYLHQLKGMDYQTRLNTTRRRLDGTCQWFRQHPGFRGWLDSDGGLLLVSASAGCGKSVLAKYLIEELLHEEDVSATICYFFFKDSDPQARSSLNASRAILHGFLKSNPEMVNVCMEKLPMIDDDISNTDVWSVFDKVSRAQGAGRVVCVLDALDECDSRERDDFINCLEDYVIENRGTTGAKFIVTTRGYPQIIHQFTGFSSNKIHLDGDSDEEKRQIQKEISIVMDDRLSKLETTMPDISPATLDIIRTGLIENSTEQRTYLWMHLMFDYIRKNRFCTREEWREIFRNPPDTVDRTYEGLLQSVTPPAKERVRTLLALILAAERPLTIAELSIAVNCRINTLEAREFDLNDIPDEKEFDTWIRWECGSFVTIYEGQAFLIHQTAKEFLLESTEADHGWWQGCMTEHVIHQYMAESCVSLLSLGKLRQQEYVDDVQTKISNAGDDVTGALQLEPFVVYSAVNWVNHFSKCQKSSLSDRKVVDIGKDFFDLYLSLFTEKHAGSYKACSEWKKRAWYLILMASKPDGIFPDMVKEDFGYRPFSIDALTVSNFACLFDHRRLLMLALDVLEEDIHHATNNTAIQNIRKVISLHFAAHSSLWCLTHLHTRGYDIDLKDFDGQTPLHKAMFQGSVLAVENLLKFGASKNSLDRYNRTPAAFSIVLSASPWIERYVESFELEKHESEMRDLLYHCAIAEAPNSHEVFTSAWMQEAIKALEMPDNQARRMHHMALAHARRCSPVGRILTWRFDNRALDIRHDHGLTMLHISVERKERIGNTIALCSCERKMIYAVDDSGNTPLHIAVVANNLPAVMFIHFLMAFASDKSDVAFQNIQGEQGDTPLHMACRMGNWEVAEFLMQSGVVNLEIRNDDGLTALELDRPPRLGVGLAELIRRRNEDPTFLMCDNYDEALCH